jgi:hypothetical protein
VSVQDRADVAAAKTQPRLDDVGDVTVITFFRKIVNKRLLGGRSAAAGQRLDRALIYGSEQRLSTIFERRQRPRFLACGGSTMSVRFAEALALVSLLSAAPAGRSIWVSV